jgi:mono/diheme cytochrome c family protein
MGRGFPETYTSRGPVGATSVVRDAPPARIWQAADPVNAAHRLPTASLLLALLAVSCAPKPAPETPRSWARALTNVRFERTPERLARGRYLAEGVLQCAVCHSERAWGLPGAPPRPGREYAGHIVREDSVTLIVAPNITPDRKTGAGTWTDDMLARAIREGVGHDGRALHPQMWYGPFRSLADEDLAAIVVYLRSLAPVRNALPATRLTAQRREQIEGSLKPLLAAVPAPDTTTRIGGGRYLEVLADCSGCHTSWYTPYNPGLLAGGNKIELWGRTAFSANITPDPTGIGDWTPETFIEVMRTGKSGTLDPLMPWNVFRNMTDRDLGDLFAFLTSMAPSPHLIDNHSDPTRCAICGQTHGRGAENKRVTPRGIRVDAKTLADYAGIYHSKEFNFTRTVTLRKGHLYGREEGGPEIELVPTSPAHFLAPGWLAPIEFVRDTSGRVRGQVSKEIQDLVLDRVEP